MVGAIGDFRLADLKDLKLLNIDGRPSRESIPTLDEVLDLADRQRPAKPFTVNIELKCGNCAPAVATAVGRRLARGWDAEDFLISSFAMDSLKEIGSRLPELPIGTLFECSGDELPRQDDRNWRSSTQDN
jgi:glycerophosphoryl diester phosphodiesterase